MKGFFIRLGLIISLISVPFFTTILYADSPVPPIPGGAPFSSGGHPVGTNGPGGAPIGDGVAILLILGGAYGCYKAYEFWKKKENQRKEDPGVSVNSALKKE